MHAIHSAKFKTENWVYFIAAPGILLGVALRLWIHPSADLWQDEIIAVTHAQQSFWDVIISAIRYDTHPPVYFIQLHFWSLLGTSDQWMMLNSVLWSLGAIVSLGLVVRRHFGSDIGLKATAVYALLPAPVYLSDQVRMYGMLSVPIIWSFHFCFRSFFATETRSRSLLWLFCLLTTITFTHAIGVVAAAAFALFSAVGARKSNMWRSWLLVFAPISIIAIPVLASGFIHDASLYQGKGINSLLWPLASISTGIFSQSGGLWMAIGLSTSIFVVAFGLINAQYRTLTLCFFVIPVLTCTVLAMTSHPIFKWNFFSIFEAPFIAMLMAFAMHNYKRCVFIFAILILAGLGASSVAEKFTFRESSWYKMDADVIAKNYQSGDIVYIPQLSNFWGVARYLIGPRWGSPLRIANAPSASWHHIYNMIGSDFITKIGLLPTSPELSSNGYHIVTGDYRPDEFNGAKRIWLVENPASDLPRNFPPKSIIGMNIKWQRLTHTSLILYAPESTRSPL